jgi:phage shock protein A
MTATEQDDQPHESAAKNPMVNQDTPDPQFDAMTSRLLRREALRRAAEELSTMTGPGLENALARLSAEVTEEAAYKHATADSKANQAKPAAIPKPPAQA